MINVNYGDLLTNAILILQQALFSLSIPIHRIFNSVSLPEMDTRGKLSVAEIDILVINNIPNICFLYVVRLG